MAYKQIMMLLHVLNSFIPEECVVETEIMKPKIDPKTGGLDYLEMKVPMTDEQARNIEASRKKLASMALNEMPFDQPFILSNAASSLDDDESERRSDEAFFRRCSRYSGEPREEGGEGDGGITSRMGRTMLEEGQLFQMQMASVARILVIPVRVTYVTIKESTDGYGGEERDGGSSIHGGGEDNDDDGSDDGSDGHDTEGNGGKKPCEEVELAWMVVLVPTLGYNFAAHLQYLVNSVDKEVS
jgi:hypothetical protein